MAFYSGQTSVGTAATLVDGALIGATAGNPFRLYIHNNDNTDEMYLGGSGVTTTTGFKLEKLQSMSLIVSPLDRLYAVSSKAGHVISWLTEPV